MAAFWPLRYIAASGLMKYLGKTMKKTAITLLLTMIAALASAADKVPAHPHLNVETTVGTFKLELDGKAAPLTVANFLKLVDEGFYNGTIFHRIRPGFMIQGGGYTPGFKSKQSDETVPNESGNNLSNIRGTIAMARLGAPHSASSQFFINVANNIGESFNSTNLEPIKDPIRGRWGYTVFGNVIEGMDVVDAIANAESAPNGPGGEPAPIVPIVIKSITPVTYD
jgi:cyclophilin family peptidyl-prolyl cis-trans isomerase